MQTQCKFAKLGFVAKKHLLAAALGLLFLFSSGMSQAQITPLGDAYTNTADSTTNYGAATLLDVDGASQTTYIQFNLASIPATASVSEATLKLYVNSVTKAGSFNVDYVNGAWSESKIDASNAPPLGAAIASNVNVTTADKNQYILVNVPLVHREGAAGHLWASFGTSRRDVRIRKMGGGPKTELAR